MYIYYNNCDYQSKCLYYFRFYSLLCSTAFHLTNLHSLLLIAWLCWLIFLLCHLNFHYLCQLTLWSIYFSKLSILKYHKWTITIRWTHTKYITSFPCQWGYSCIMVVTHPAYWTHWYGIVYQNTWRGGNGKNHIVILFKYSYIWFGFLE